MTTWTTIEVGGHTLAYAEAGAGAPLVFLHGGLSSVETSFPSQWDHFATTHRVIGIEQPGQGHSPDHDDPWTYQRMADDTRLVLAHLGVVRASFVGWSDGGIIALLLASQHPELVSHAVVAGANVSFTGLDPGFRSFLNSSAEQMQQVLASNRDEYQRLNPGPLSRWPQILAKCRALWSTPDALSPQDLARIQARVLVVAGDRDLVTGQHTVTLFESIPGAQLLILPGTSHAVFQELGPLLDGLIRDFLRVS